MKRISLAIAFAAMSGCTAAPPGEQAAEPAAGRDCFNVSMVQGFVAVDRDTVRLDAGPGASYELDIQGGQCSEIDWAQRLALESTSSSWLCTGRVLGQGNVYFRDPSSRRRLTCYIEDVRRVPDAPPPGTE